MKESIRLLKFEPIIHPSWGKLDYKEIRGMLDKWGSPLNLFNLDIMDENIQRYLEVIEDANISAKIYFAHKTTKNIAFIENCKKLGIYLDVASLDELENVLRLGIKPENIEATGPKNKCFLKTLIEKNICVNIDNEDELDDVIDLMKLKNSKNNNYKDNNSNEEKQKLPILIRLTNFQTSSKNRINKLSRFGIDILKIDNVLKKIYQNSPILDLKGFSFHIDTINIEEKVDAFENCINCILKANEYGLSPNTIDIGGGHNRGFCTSKDIYDKSIMNIKKSLEFELDALTYDRFMYGMHFSNNKVQGNLPTYISKEDCAHNYLRKFLNTNLPSMNRKISDILNDLELELMMEPGFSLVSNASCIIAEVNFIKELANSEFLAGLDMTSFNAKMINSEVFADPILIYEDLNVEKSKNQIGELYTKSFPYYLAGNLCLEADLMYHRKIFFDRELKKGDIIFFANTGGYISDFLDARPIMQKRPTLINYTNMKGNDY